CAAPALSGRDERTAGERQVGRLPVEHADAPVTGVEERDAGRRPAAEQVPVRVGVAREVVARDGEDAVAEPRRGAEAAIQRALLRRGESPLREVVVADGKALQVDLGD